MKNYAFSTFTQWVRALRGGLHGAAHGGVAPNGYAVLLRHSVQGAPPCAPVQFSEPHP